MRQANRTRLFSGPYKAPPFKVGQVVRCSIQGPVTIGGVSKGKIPWPRVRRSLVVYGDLESAIRTESALAVAHWWGVTDTTVTNWRRSLGVERYNAGTVKLRRASYYDPERSRKMRAAKLGKRRAPHTAESKEKIRAALKRYYGT